MPSELLQQIFAAIDDDRASWNPDPHLDNFVGTVKAAIAKLPHFAPAAAGQDVEERDWPDKPGVWMHEGMVALVGKSTIDNRTIDDPVVLDDNGLIGYPRESFSDWHGGWLPCTVTPSPAPSEPAEREERPPMPEVQPHVVGHLWACLEGGKDPQWWAISSDGYATGRLNGRNALASELVDVARRMGPDPEAALAIYDRERTAASEPREGE